MKQPKRLLTSGEVAIKIGKSKDWVLRNMGKKFPSPYYITGTLNGWKENQVQEYIEKKEGEK